MENKITIIKVGKDTRFWDVSRLPVGGDLKMTPISLMLKVDEIYKNGTVRATLPDGTIGVFSIGPSVILDKMTEF